MIIVKNLSLPDCCAVCKLTDSDDSGIYCNALEVFMRFDELPKGRRSDCPIFDENVETIQSIVLIGRNGNAAEYEKVTRCEDCKHRYTECGMGFCEKLDSMFYHYEDQEPIDADFYCKWAEPKGDKDDR